MDDWMVTALVQVGTILGVTFFVCFVFQWVTKGFLFKYLKVFASRGSKLLVEVITPLDSYFSLGVVDNNFLIFKTKYGKVVRRVPLKEHAVFHWLGVKTCRIDEEGNYYVTPKKGLISGFDAERYEHYSKKMYLAGKEDDVNKKLLLLLLIGVVLAIAVSGFAVYQIFTLKDLVEALKVLVETANLPII